MSKPVALAFFLLALGGWAIRPAVAQSNHRLESHRQAGDVDHVHITLEVGGDLLDSIGGKPERKQMSVVGDFRYHEKTLQLPSESDPTARSARLYDKAVAVIKIEKESIKPSLPPDRSLLVVESDVPAITIFSPHGPLTGEQLDLVDFLGNTLLYDHLLPDDPVAPEASWELPQPVVAGLLEMDAIEKSDVECTLTEVTETLARFQIAGTAEGIHDGARTEVELRGKYRLDRHRQRIDWLALLMKEHRQFGPVAAGLDVVVRLQVVIKPKVACEDLADAKLAGLPLESTSELRNLVLRPDDGRWQLIRDRRWQDVSSMGQSRTVVPLRLVDEGQFVAQCNLSQLPDESKKKPVTLEAYQADVERALGDQLEEFIEAGQSASSEDYRIYRVSARGKVEDRPVRWIHYLITERTGRQAALAFMIEGDMIERFDNADRDLLAGFRFLEPPPKETAGVPTKAQPK